jgi:hypothetical protein
MAPHYSGPVPWLIVMRGWSAQVDPGGHVDRGPHRAGGLAIDQEIWIGSKNPINPLLRFDGRTNEMRPLPCVSAEDATSAFTGTGHAAASGLRRCGPKRDIRAPSCPRRKSRISIAATCQSHPVAEGKKYPIDALVPVELSHRHRAQTAPVCVSNPPVLQHVVQHDQTAGPDEPQSTLVVAIALLLVGIDERSARSPSSPRTCPSPMLHIMK